MILMEYLNIRTAEQNSEVGSKALDCSHDCSCGFVVILDIAGDCGQMQLMWLQLVSRIVFENHERK